jgi:protein-arginine kinase activator protein McsA
MKPCENCSDPATFVVRTDDVERHFCSKCLRHEEPVLGIVDLLDRMAGPSKQTRICPYCGWKSSEVEHTGKVGCPLCYEALNSPLLREFERH